MAKGNLSAALQKVAPPPRQEVKAPGEKARDGKKLVGAFITREGSRNIRALAFERDTTVQALVIEALSDLLEKYGKARLT